MYINDKGIYYITNDDTSKDIEDINKYSEFSEEEKRKRIKKGCTLWTSEQVDNYFINIIEKRKEKIANIKKKFNV
jgi:hypothetical protein